MIKVCSKCRITKTADNFNKCSARQDGLQNYCSQCTRTYNKETGRARALSYRYKLTTEQVDEAIENQNGICPLCLKNKELVVDHNHESGVFRGMLCRTCNIWLGPFENTEWRKRAESYLGKGEE